MPMFSDPYIEALLVDEELADHVWEMWDAGFSPEDLAALDEAWWITANVCSYRKQSFK